MANKPVGANIVRPWVSNHIAQGKIYTIETPDTTQFVKQQKSP